MGMLLSTEGDAILSVLISRALTSMTSRPVSGEASVSGGGI